MPRQRPAHIAKRPNHRQQNADANYPAKRLCLQQNKRRQCRNTVQNDFDVHKLQSKAGPKADWFCLKSVFLCWAGGDFPRQPDNICRPPNSKGVPLPGQSLPVKMKCPHTVTSQSKSQTHPCQHAGTLTKSMRRSRAKGENIVRSRRHSGNQGVSPKAL